MEKRYLGLFLLVLLVLASQEVMIPGEAARMCESQSHRFRRACMSSPNCATVCRTEGFSGGRCRGFRRRCFCTKRC